MGWRGLGWGMRVKVGMEDFGCRMVGLRTGGENEGPRIVLKNVNETGFVGLCGTCRGCGRSGR